MAAHASIWIEKFDRAERILDRLSPRRATRAR